MGGGGGGGSGGSSGFFGGGDDCGGGIVAIVIVVVMGVPGTDVFVAKKHTGMHTFLLRFVSFLFNLCLRAG